MQKIAASISTLAVSAATTYAHSHIASVAAAGGTHAARAALLTHASVHGYTVGFAVSAVIFLVGAVVAGALFERRVTETEVAGELVMAH